jgi:hypothetical protein
MSRAAFYNRSISTRESELGETEGTLPGVAGEISPFLSQCVTIADNCFEGESIQSWHRRLVFCHHLITLFARYSIG